MKHQNLWKLALFIIYWSFFVGSGMCSFWTVEPQEIPHESACLAMALRLLDLNLAVRKATRCKKRWFLWTFWEHFAPDRLNNKQQLSEAKAFQSEAQRWLGFCGCLRPVGLWLTCTSARKEHVRKCWFKLSVWQFHDDLTVDVNLESDDFVEFPQGKLWCCCKGLAAHRGLGSGEEQLHGRRCPT